METRARLCGTGSQSSCSVGIVKMGSCLPFLHLAVMLDDDPKCDIARVTIRGGAVAAPGTPNRPCLRFPQLQSYRAIAQARIQLHHLAWRSQIGNWLLLVYWHHCQVYVFVDMDLMTFLKATKMLIRKWQPRLLMNPTHYLN